MGRHDATGTRAEVIVYDPDQPKWRRRCWWVVQRVLFLPPLAGLALAIFWDPVGGAIATLAPLGLALLINRPGVRIGPYAGIVLSARQSLGDWRQVDEACRIITRSWPALGDLAEPRDIGPVLARARYQLAQFIAARGRLDKAVDEVLGAPAGLPLDSPLRTRLAEQRQALMDRHRAVDAEITARIAALRRLATSSAEHAQQERAAERARQVLHRAERTGAGTIGLPASDSLAEVEERTAAVLGAYRDLVAQFSHLEALPPDPRR